MHARDLFSSNIKGQRKTKKKPGKKSKLKIQNHFYSAVNSVNYKTIKCKSGRCSEHTKAKFFFSRSVSLAIDRIVSDRELIKKLHDFTANS